MNPLWRALVAKSINDLKKRMVEAFERPRRRNQGQEQMVFTKSQVLAALQKAIAERRVDYLTSTFISYLIDKGRLLTVEQAKAIGLLVPMLKGRAAEQKMIRIEDDGDPR
jgi:hypothetical protein